LSSASYSRTVKEKTLSVRLHLVIFFHKNITKCSNSRDSNGTCALKSQTEPFPSGESSEWPRKLAKCLVLSSLSLSLSPLSWASFGRDTIQQQVPTFRGLWTALLWDPGFIKHNHVCQHSSSIGIARVVEARSCDALPLWWSKEVQPETLKSHDRCHS
jgi:hypothetical protein